MIQLTQRAEQSRAEQSRAEQSRAEQSRADKKICHFVDPKNLLKQKHRLIFCLCFFVLKICCQYESTAQKLRLPNRRGG
ncbi:MAG: hypothetical protein FWG64_00080 [Firmicutes bacterium]|nr:hypothetical protein [Bacillota bacterium]